MTDKKETEDIGKEQKSHNYIISPRLCWVAFKSSLSYADDFLGSDYSLNNPDTLTKYKSAAQISHKALEAVTALCVAGEKIVTICEKGDKLLDEEIAKVYRGKKISKG